MNDVTEAKHAYRQLLHLMRMESVEQFANDNTVYAWMLSRVPSQIYRKLLNVNPTKAALSKRFMRCFPRKLILFPLVWIAFVVLRIRERNHWSGALCDHKAVASDTVVWMQYRSLLKDLTDAPMITELRLSGLCVVEFPKYNFAKRRIWSILFHLPLEINDAVNRVHEFIVKTDAPSCVQVDSSFIVDNILISPRLVSLVGFAVLIEPFVRSVANSGGKVTLVSRTGGEPIGSLIRGIRKTKTLAQLEHLHIPHSSNVGDMVFSDADYFADVLCARSSSQQHVLSTVRGELDKSTPLLGNPEAFYLKSKRPHTNREGNAFIYVLVAGAYLSDRSKRELDWLSNVLAVCQNYKQTVVKAKNADRRFSLLRLAIKIGPSKGFSLYRHSKGVGLEQMIKDAAIGIVVVNDKNYVSNIFDDLAYFGIPRLVYTEDDPERLINKNKEILSKCVNARTIRTVLEQLISDGQSSESQVKYNEHQLDSPGVPGEMSPGQRLFEILELRKALSPMSNALESRGSRPI